MGFFGLFEKKMHRQKYGAAERNLERRGEALGRSEYKFLRRDHESKDTADLSFDPLVEIDRTVANYQRAKRKLEKLYEEGHEEALKLNEKYDALFEAEEIARKKYDSILDKALSRKEGERTKPLPGNPTLKALKEWGSAYRKLEDFERDELGLHERSGTKKNIGTLTGIVSIGAFILAGVLGSGITGNIVNTTGNFSFSNGSILLVIGFVFGLAWLFLRK